MYEVALYIKYKELLQKSLLHCMQIAMRFQR